MFDRFRHRFATRVFLYIAALSLCTSFVSAAVYYYRQLGFLQKERTRRAKALLFSLATQAELGAYAGDPALCNNAVDSTFRQDDVLLAAVYDRHGVELLRYSAPTLSPPSPGADQIEPLIAQPETELASRLMTDSSGEQYDDLYRPIVTQVRDVDEALRGSGNTTGLKREAVGVARVGLSLKPARDQLHEVVVWGSLLASGLLALGLLAAFLISRRVAQPLAALTRGAEALRAGQLEVQVAVESQDELGQLAEAFNRMAARLREGMLALETLNRDLESQVERRTAELHQRNIALAQQRDQLQEMNRLKSEFLANVSHELRTPLNAIIGYTELIAEETYGSVTAEQRSALGGIDESGHNLIQLINQILDLSKIEAGKMELFLEEVDLTSLARAVVAETTPLTKDRPYRVELVAAAPSRIRTDGAKVKQILTNLVSNAIKFTPHGRVDLTIRPQPQGGCTLAVRDSGIGIKTEDMAIIFEEFRQVDGSSTRTAGGTGLGLAIARRVAELLGGSLTVESQPHVGSIFTLHLPQQPPFEKNGKTVRRATA